MHHLLLMGVAVLALSDLAAADVAPAAPEMVPPIPENIPERPDSPDGWPIGFQMFPQRVAKPGAQPRPDIRVWTPPGAKRLRAVFLIPANSDSKHV
ncbi:MAG: hypothetical protein RL456_3451, partial [Pseudomonadota bacterium]